MASELRFTTSRSRPIKVWAIKTKSMGGKFMDRKFDNDEERHNQFNICLKENMIGIGWALEKGRPRSFEEYEAMLAKQRPDWKSRDVTLLANKGDRGVRDGDLVWTRSPRDEQEYYLGRVSGGWRYRSEQAYIDYDIPNQRPVAKWIEIGKELDRIPGEVIRGLGRGRTVVELKEYPGTIELSKQLYRDNSQPKDEDQRYLPKERLDPWELLSPWDWEDLVGMYLQVVKGFSIVPSTRGPNTALYEYELVKEEDGRSRYAFAQVKTGRIDLEQYTEGLSELYVFSCRESYYWKGKRVRGKDLPDFKMKYPSIIFVERPQLESFAKSRPLLLTQRIRSLFDLAGNVRRSTMNDKK